MNRWRGILIAILTLTAASPPGFSEDPHVFENASIRQVIQQIEAATDLRFLYRDAVIAGRTVSFRAASGDVLEAFSIALEPHRIGLKTDARRRQVFLFEKKVEPVAAPASISGFVIDDPTGARLPHATVTWMDDGRLRGVAANAAGAFSITLDGISEEIVTFRVSYVGYEPALFTVDRRIAAPSISVRLRPRHVYAQDVLITSTPHTAEADTTWRDLIRMGTFAPFGEHSVMRSLQPLPSVGVSSALSSGLNVRGSRADGFQVLLDGVSIYNQQHFFGLFDAFNEDALQKVGFYYDVAPAYLAGPPGGTLAFLTRTGSQAAARQTIGASNTAYKATVEGPFPGLSGSWLISGRQSYLNNVNWFNNTALVAWGLGVGRKTSPLPEAYRELDDRLVLPGPASARFYDVHTKLYHETRAGARLMLNAYMGGDETVSHARRYFLEPVRPEQHAMQLRPIETSSRWGNEAASVQFQHATGRRSHVDVTAGFSRYHSNFSQDDFVYTRWAAPASTFLNFIESFGHETELFELKATVNTDLAIHRGGVITTGVDGSHFVIEYREASALRPAFFMEQRAVRLDGYAHYDLEAGSALALQAGVRTHYFSNGDFLGVSPRIQVRLLPQQPLSLGAGYSRSHQFLHRLYLAHINSPDVWVLSSELEPPGRTSNYSAGVYLRPDSHAWFQIEAYHKSSVNLRQHETNAYRPTAPRSLLLSPWYHDSEGTAEGVEVLYRQRLGPLVLTNSYALSRVEMRNPMLNHGAPFSPEWDRHHQFTSSARVALHRDVAVTLNWLFASGTPNPFSDGTTEEPVRLGDYHRLDGSVQVDRTWHGLGIRARFSAFNLYDRANPWYRTAIPAFRSERAIQRIEFVNLDVYDLGFQPSFDLTLRF